MPHFRYWYLWILLYVARTTLVWVHGMHTVWTDCKEACDRIVSVKLMYIHSNDKTWKKNHWLVLQNVLLHSYNLTIWHGILKKKSGLKITNFKKKEKNLLNKMVQNWWKSDKKYGSYDILKDPLFLENISWPVLMNIR